MDYLKVIGEFLVPIIITIATPIVLLLGKRLVVYLEKKWGFKMSDEMQKKLDGIIVAAIQFAEEKAMAAMKTGKEIPDGAKKLEEALNYAQDEIKRLGLDELAAEKLTDLIKSKLFKMREDGKVPRTLKGPAAKKLLTEG